MPYLVDGYNLQKQIQKIDPKFETLSDTYLCKILSRYLKSIRDQSQIIFDGIGPPDKTGFENLDNIEVIFTGRNIDADSVIEQKIKANTAPKKLVVVSSDRRLRVAAAKRKAIGIKSEDFWLMVTSQLSRRSKRRAEPRSKHDGLTQSET
ncbi:MAG: NYN domain-containing protein, partial [Planctomycetota bacterium]